MISTSSSLLKNRHYRLFLQAASVSNLGDGIALLALPWLATLLTRDAAQIALVTAALRLPWLLFSLPAGLMADRINRRALILWADTLRLLVLVVVVLGLGQLHALDQLSASQSQVMIVGLATVAFVLGMAEVLRDNTAQTLLPALVSEQHLEKANGQLWSAEQLVGQFVGPPLAGWLILQSLASPFIANALCLALAWYFVFLIRLPKCVVAPKQVGIWLQVREAFGWLYERTQMFRLALMLGAYNFLVTGLFTVLILFSQDVLNLNAVQHGMLLTAGAVGGVIGGIACPRIITRLGGTRSVHLALLLSSTAFLMIALANSVLWVALALLTEMFAAIMWNVVTVSLRQRSIPNWMLGRVNSVYRLIGWGMMPLGALAAGFMVDVAQASMSLEQALRLYYALAWFGAFLLFVYGFLRLRIEPVRE